MMSVQEALTFVLARTGLDDTETNRLISDLELFAGINPMGAKVYRPYYSAGRELWLSTDNNLKSAEGATFDQNFEVVRRYLTTQYLLDTQQQLTVPLDYSAQVLLTLVFPPTSPVSTIAPVGFMSF